MQLLKEMTVFKHNHVIMRCVIKAVLCTTVLYHNEKRILSICVSFLSTCIACIRGNENFPSVKSSQ